MHPLTRSRQYERSGLNRLSSWQKARARGQIIDDLVLSEMRLHALSGSCLFFHFLEQPGKNEALLRIRMTLCTDQGLRAYSWACFYAFCPLALVRIS